MLRMMQAHTQLHRGILFITVSKDTITPAIKQEMAAIADMVCDFKVRTIGSDFETSMTVTKFRNAPENLSIMVYRVTPERRNNARNSRAYRLISSDIACVSLRRLLNFSDYFLFLDNNYFLIFFSFQRSK